MLGQRTGCALLLVGSPPLPPLLRTHKHMHALTLMHTLHAIERCRANTEYAGRFEWHAPKADDTAHKPQWRDTDTFFFYGGWVVPLCASG